MRISDWSSDVCSSDLPQSSRSRAAYPTALLRREVCIVDEPPIRTGESGAARGLSTCVCARFQQFLNKYSSHSERIRHIHDNQNKNTEISEGCSRITVVILDFPEIVRIKIKNYTKKIGRAHV